MSRSEKLKPSSLKVTTNVFEHILSFLGFEEVLRLYAGKSVLEDGAKLFFPVTSVNLTASGGVVFEYSWRLGLLTTKLKEEFDNTRISNRVEGEFMKNETTLEKMSPENQLVILLLTLCIKNMKPFRLYFPPLVDYWRNKEFFYCDIDLSSLDNQTALTELLNPGSEISKKITDITENITTYKKPAWLHEVARWMIAHQTTLALMRAAALIALYTLGYWWVHNALSAPTTPHKIGVNCTEGYNSGGIYSIHCADETHCDAILPFLNYTVTFLISACTSLLCTNRISHHEAWIETLGNLNGKPPINAVCNTYESLNHFMYVFMVPLTLLLLAACDIGSSTNRKFMPIGATPDYQDYKKNEAKFTKQGAFFFKYYSNQQEKWKQEKQEKINVVAPESEEPENVDYNEQTRLISS